MARNKTVIVTGGAHAIGRCLVKRFLEDGHKVYILDPDEVALLATLQSHIRPNPEDPVNLDGNVCDLEDADERDKGIDKAVAFFDGPVDVLVTTIPAVLQPETEIEAGAVSRAYGMTKACLPAMRAQHGDARHVAPCIIHITPAENEMRSYKYAAVKAALKGFMKSNAITFQSEGIRVNLVILGRIKEARDRNANPNTTFATPDDVYGTVMYFANAAFVIGQHITVDRSPTGIKKPFGNPIKQAPLVHAAPAA